MKLWKVFGPTHSSEFDQKSGIPFVGWLTEDFFVGPRTFQRLRVYVFDLVISFRLTLHSTAHLHPTTLTNTSLHMVPTWIRQMFFFITWKESKIRRCFLKRLTNQTRINGFSSVPDAHSTTHTEGQSAKGHRSKSWKRYSIFRGVKRLLARRKRSRQNVVMINGMYVAKKKFLRKYGKRSW